jgi:hypothetical protein
MNGRRYYLTTLAAWRNHAGKFANSHWLLLGEASHGEPPASTRILLLAEADEGIHVKLEDDPDFEALPHPLAQKPISAAAQGALAAQGVAAGATTFDAAETVGRLHPLLRHRIF